MEPTITKGNLVLFNRKGKLRAAAVRTKGKKNIGLNVAEMKSNTTIPANSKLIPVMIFVTEEAMEKLNELVEPAA